MDSSVPKNHHVYAPEIYQYDILERGTTDSIGDLIVKLNELAADGWKVMQVQGEKYFLQRALRRNSSDFDLY